MGRVYLGRSAGGRLVAVKVIKDELAGDAEFRARFRQEVAGARLVSGLYTAPVVDADLDGPVPWLATAYVAGPSLAGAIAAHGLLPPGSVLALAAALAEGLAAIHAAEVVHRDLKPSNVLLAADGPRIIDFGIARAAEATALTQSGLVMGSPGFMSPEQAEGLLTGPPSDVFSLGAVLTFAATGIGPFGTGLATALVYRVVHNPPELANVPGEIRDLIGRCLAKDPRQRPTTAGLLAELGGADLAPDWLPGPFTSAHPAAPAAPAPPAPVEVDQRTALVRGARAERSRQEPAGLLLARLDHDATVAGVLFSPGGERMLTISDKTGRLWNQDFKELAQLRHELYPRGNGAVFSPDGTTIATQTLPPMIARKNPVLLWEAGEGDQIATLPHQHAVTGVAFTPDGNRIATTTARDVRIWDPRTGQEVARLRSSAAITGSVLSPDGTRLVALTYSGTKTSLLYTATGAEAGLLLHRAALQSAAFSPDGSRLLMFGADGTARLWDASAGREIPWRAHTRLIDVVTGEDQPWTERMPDWTAAFNPAARQLATAGVDGVVRLWDPANGQQTFALPHGGPVGSLVFSPDGTRMITVSNHRDIRVWDPASGRELPGFASTGTVTMLRVSPDSTRLIAGMADRTVRLWDLASGAPIRQVRHGALLVISPDLTRIASATGPGVHLRDLVTGTELARMPHSDPVAAMTFSPDGTRLATRSGRRVALWVA